MVIGINALGKISERGGGRVYYKNAVENMIRHGGNHRFVIFMSSEKEDIFQITSKNVTKIYCCRIAQKEGTRKLFAEMFILPLLLIRHRIDVLYSCNFIPLFCHCRTVLVVHDMRFFYEFDDLGRKTVKKFLYPFFIKAASKIISSSQVTTKDIIKFIRCRQEKIATVYPGVDLSRFSPSLAVPNRVYEKIGITVNDKYILFVSSLFPRKNAHGLIEAYARAVEKFGLKHKLVIIGRIDGAYEPVLQKLCEKLDLAGKVIFIGFIEDSDLPYYYRAADIFVFPSLFEGFGIPIVEAMAAGIPLVAVDATTSPEIIGDAGLLAHPGDIDDLAGKINQAIVDLPLRDRLVAKGLERARNFSWDATGRETMEVIRTSAKNVGSGIYLA
jgi:glycosyltransferase involved in cell wall biosynthesis